MRVLLVSRRAMVALLRSIIVGAASAQADLRSLAGETEDRCRPIFERKSDLYGGADPDRQAGLWKRRS